LVDFEVALELSVLWGWGLGTKVGFLCLYGFWFKGHV
jgi:hypothetical protein